MFRPKIKVDKKISKPREKESKPTESFPNLPIPKKSFEKPLVINKQSKQPVTHDRFKCEQCDERLDTKNCLLNHMISEHNQPGDVLECDYCEFKTSRRYTYQKSMM